VIARNCRGTLCLNQLPRAGRPLMSSIRWNDVISVISIPASFLAALGF
jgi:hypothetical protein